MQQIDSDETLIAEPVELSEVNSGGIGLAALMRCSVSDHNAHTSHILLTVSYTHLTLPTNREV